MRFRKTSVMAVAVALICIAGATLIFAESAPPRVLFVERMIHQNKFGLSFGSGETGDLTVPGAEGKVIVFSRIIVQPSPEAIQSGEKEKIQVKVYQRRAEQDVVEKDVLDQKIKIEMDPDQLPDYFFKTIGERFTYGQILTMS